jgi:hypothetical protein
MSVVTNTILSVGGGRISPAFLDAVNSFFDPPSAGFVSVDDERLPDGWYGGSKYLEAGLAIGAFNHLDLDDPVRHLRALAPGDPYLQLIVMEQEDNRFRIINVFDEPEAPVSEVTGQ